MACIVGRYQGWWLWELQSNSGACACLRGPAWRPLPEQFLMDVQEL